VKKITAILLLIAFAFCAGFEPVYLLVKKVNGEQYLLLTDCDDAEEGDAEKEGEKESEKISDKEFYLFAYNSIQFNSEVLSHENPSDKNFVQAGFSGEVFCPPESLNS
jgi:hypothetical protein